MNNTIDSNDGPLVSIIVPTHNRADAVLRAIDSLLRQSYPRIEVVVVDDASTDNTADAIAHAYAGDPRVRYVRNSTNVGCAATRNTGMSAAKGEYVAFLDDDDEYLPDNIARLLAVFSRNSDVDVVVAGVAASRTNDDAGPQGWVEAEFHPSMVFDACRIMCKASSVQDIRLRCNYMEWRDFGFQVYEKQLRVLLCSENQVRKHKTLKCLSGDTNAMLSWALNNAKLYYEASRGRKEHAVFKHYLAHCYKGIGNFSLKKGKVWTAIGSYISSYRTERKLRNIVPFA